MNQNNKYFLYVRKSSEGEDRQVQSLGDQVDVMTKKAQQLGINIIGTFSESQSAKAPGRKEFNKMIALLYEGKADGIIAWKLDRLSRNPIDTGTVQYMLQNGTLQKIITSDREYHPVDAGLLMSVETGMANQYIIDLRKNVLRGMNSKTEKGIFCGQAPEGYRNNKEEKTIQIDALNFRLVRKAWDFLLSGIYTVPQIVEMMNTDYAYKSNKKGRKEMTIGGLYGIFKNVFYTGNFMWKGEIKTGTHAPMISMQEFEKVQDILGRKWTKVRPKTLEFAYSGIIRCGECGSSIVATQKTKLIKTSGETKDYIYYHCSKRKKGCSCSQKRITLETLESQIESYLEKIEIIPEFRDFALKILKNSYKNEIQNQEFLKNNIKHNITDIEKKIERLLDLLIDGSVSNDIYQKKKELLQKELCIYREKLAQLEADDDGMIEKVEEMFDFVTLAKKRFQNGTLKEKKIILSKLGENFVLFDEKLSLRLHCWFQPLDKYLPRIRGIHIAGEPTKKGISLGKTDASLEYISLWSEGPGLNWHTQGLKP